jgi:hypothetical protein
VKIDTNSELLFTKMVFFSRSELSTQYSENTSQHDFQKVIKMPQPSVRYIEDLSARDTEKLATLLTLGWRTKPTLQWLSEQKLAIDDLPSCLQKPGLFLKLAMSLPKTPEKAVFCPSHKALNPFLIHRLFFQLSAECTTRLTRLEENPRLAPNLRAFLTRIHSINSLWLSPYVYQQLFNIPEKEECLVEMVHGGCEACILSVVGANLQMLNDLRASMLGRRKKGLPRPRLLKIVDAWIDGTGHGLDIRRDSDELGKEIRECRRQMQKARRQKRRNIKDGIIENELPEEQKPLLSQNYEEEAMPEDAFDMDGKEKDEKAEEYFESSILDYYTGGLNSSTKAASRTRTPTPLPENSVHPAFRDSLMTFDNCTGTFHLRGTSPPPPPESAARGTWTSSVPPSTARQSSTRRGTWSTWTTEVPSTHNARVLPCEPPPLPSTPRRAPTIYTASVYSINQFGDPSFAPSPVPEVPSILDTEQRERAYRRMMGIDDNEKENGETDRRRSRDSKLSNERVSEWVNNQRSRDV